MASFHKTNKRPTRARAALHCARHALLRGQRITRSAVRAVQQERVWATRLHWAVNVDRILIAAASDWPRGQRATRFAPVGAFDAPIDASYVAAQRREPRVCANPCRIAREAAIRGASAAGPWLLTRQHHGERSGSRRESKGGAHRLRVCSNSLCNSEASSAARARSEGRVVTL